jgi:membrane-associated protease RseP (regulator of RpoE activity)
MKNTSMGKKAEALRLEAEAEQLQVDKERIMAEKARLREIDGLVLKLLQLPLPQSDQSSEAVFGNSLVNEMDELLSVNQPLLRKELFFRLVELANACAAQPERERYLSLFDATLESVKRVDQSLWNEINGGIQRELTAETNRLKQARKSQMDGNAEMYDRVLESWVKQTVSNSSSADMEANDLGIPPFGAMIPGSNVSLPQTGRAMIRFPSALPLNMLPLMLKSPEITEQDAAVLKEAVFTPDVLNNTIVDQSGFIITFRGDISDPGGTQAAYEKVQRRISQVPGLSERVRVFLLPEYRAEAMNMPSPNGGNQGAMLPSGSAGAQQSDRSRLEKFSGTKFEPIFTVLSTQAVPKEPGGLERGLWAGVALLALGTSFLFATDVNALNADFVKIALDGNQDAVERTLFVTAGLLGLQFTHDLGHWISAAANKVELDLPFLLPSLQLGIFGSITRFSKYPRTRKELFDVSIAGPLLGLLASLAVFLVGLDATATASAAEMATFPALPNAFFDTSFLLHELAEPFLHLSASSASAAASAASGEQLGGGISGLASALGGAGTGAAAGAGVDSSAMNALSSADFDGTRQAVLAARAAVTSVHPLVAIGAAGLLSNAFNFLPIGRLDGGRVAMAVAGRKAAGDITTATLIGLLVSAVTGPPPILIFWAVFVVLFQRGPDYPPENDVTPIASDEDDASKGLSWFGRLGALAFCSLVAGAAILPVPTEIGF